MDPHLERARTEIDAAADDADRPVQTQLHSIDEGLLAGETPGTGTGADDETDAQAGPRPDRLAELLEKLDGLQSEAAGETAARIATAEDAIRDYMHDHPQGPDSKDGETRRQ